MEYVVTNQVGEHVVLDRNELYDLVQHRLERGTNRYHDLKSKHPFFDDELRNVALDLMSVKLRTKYRRLADFTALHMFVVSLRCEHSCPYCQVSRQSDDKSTFDMSEETALNALKLVFQSPSPAIKIEFQGVSHF